MSDVLFSAIAAHDLLRVASALASGADPNVPQDQAPGWRPLHAAIEELECGGSIDVLILLLRRGAQVDAWDRDHVATPLLMACFREQSLAVRLLLAAGASPDVIGAEGDSPLRCAVEKGDAGLVELILAIGVARTLEAPGGLDGASPLGVATSRLDAAIVRLLLAAGARLSTEDADRRTAAERIPPRDDRNALEWDIVGEMFERTMTDGTPETSGRPRVGPDE